MSNSNYDFTIMIDEAKQKINRQFSSMDILRNHGKLILGSSSIFISLFTLFKITSYKIKPEYLWLYIILIAITAFLYCQLVYYSIKVALPVPLEHALKPTWETYAKAIKNEEERTILERLAHQYLVAIGHNEKTIADHYKLAKDLTWRMTALIIIILLIVVLAPFICV